MGYYQTDTITNFDPDNTEDILYIETNYSSLSIGGMIEKAKKHFGVSFSPDHFTIRAEKIHTRCIHYDLHDEGDWDNFIVIERIK